MGIQHTVYERSDQTATVPVPYNAPTLLSYRYLSAKYRNGIHSMVLKRKQVYYMTRETKVIVRRTSLGQDAQVRRKDRKKEEIAKREQPPDNIVNCGYKKEKTK